MLGWDDALIIGGISAANSGMDLLGSSMANSQNVNLWREQRDYNHPVNQVKRMAEAGLNPNLMYGSGTVANVASPAPHMEAPNMSVGNLTDYQQIKNLDAQRENLLAQNRYFKAQAAAMETDAATKARDLNALKGASEKIGIDLTSTDPWWARFFPKMFKAMGQGIPDMNDPGAFTHWLLTPNAPQSPKR